MSFLWMGNGWWSIVGLLFDIVGFGILAWDLYPEYRRMKTWQILDGIYGMIYNKAKADYLHNVDKNTPTTKEIGAVIQKFIDDLRAHDIMRLRETPNRQMMPSPVPPPPPPANNIEEQRKWMEHMDALSKDARAGLAARRRPPILLAVSLIFCGFIFQAWGSVPVEHWHDLTAHNHSLVVAQSHVSTEPALPRATGRIGGT